MHRSAVPRIRNHSDKSNIAKSKEANLRNCGDSFALGATPTMSSIVNGDENVKTLKREEVGVNSAATVSTIP